MDKDQLSPKLGRLIDAAKAAALRAADRPAEAEAPAESVTRQAEGVALLLADGTVCSAPGSNDEVHAQPAAAAVAAARRTGEVEIVAAAVAVANDPAQTLNPSPRTRRVLTEVDPNLPLVVKQQGRWVMAPLSDLPPLAAELRVERVRHPGHDLLDILEVYDLEAFGRTGLRTYDLAVMAEAGAVFLACLGDEIVGGCQLLRVLDEPTFFYVVGFYIRPAWQGLRLGRAFLDAVAAGARRLDAGGLVLTVSPDNQRAINLYESAGFVNERFVPQFYGEGQDRHILRWWFGPGGLQGSV